MIRDPEQRASAFQARDLLLATPQGQLTVLALASALKAFVRQVRLPVDFHDAPLKRRLREGVHQVLELVAGVRGEATAGRWGEAWRLYEQAEGVAVDLDHRLAQGWADAAAASRRAQYQQAGMKKNRQRGDAAARKYVREAKRLRKEHDTWTLGMIVAELRRTILSPKSTRQIYRYFHDHGLK